MGPLQWSQQKRKICTLFLLSCTKGGVLSLQREIVTTEEFPYSRVIKGSKGPRDGQRFYQPACKRRNGTNGLSKTSEAVTAITRVSSGTTAVVPLPEACCSLKSFDIPRTTAVVRVRVVAPVDIYTPLSTWSRTRLRCNVSSRSCQV